MTDNRDDYKVESYDSPQIVDDAKKETVTFLTKAPNAKIMIREGKYIYFFNFHNRTFITNNDVLLKKLQKKDNGFGITYFENEFPDYVKKEIEFEERDIHTHNWIVENLGQQVIDDINKDEAEFGD
jgi:hypothetical protein